MKEEKKNGKAMEGKKTFQVRLGATMNGKNVVQLTDGKATMDGRIVVQTPNSIPTDGDGVNVGTPMDGRIVVQTPNDTPTDSNGVNQLLVGVSMDGKNAVQISNNISSGKSDGIKNIKP